jgi:hypothetical protein
MAKKATMTPTPTTPTSAATRSSGSTNTLRNKARRVIRSNGIPFFEKWMVKDTTGGRKKSGARPSCRSVHRKLCDQLITRYRSMDRAMDKPKEKEE